MIEKNIQVAEVSVAHGQMNASRLEKVMLDFLQKKTNVLVCTKIIESGLDIPSVNTIIINRADNFGLAELYQLRGRVGRSNIKSFAYLVTPPQSSLTRQAIKRLHALEEFSELGSGMNLALRDLEIRGAGNLLGKEQSGFISELGFDTYMHILDEAIKELKSGELGEMMPEIIPKNTVQKINHDVILESDLPMFIPEEYIEDENIRLDIYQRLSKSFSAEEILNIQEELIDRFGKFTEEVQSMFAHIKLKILLSDSVYSKLTISGNSAELFFDTKNYDLFSSGKFEKIISLLNETSVENFKLHQTKKSLSLKLILKNNEDIFQQLTDFILRFGKN
jgi:transcription-repair coupling factor (superfamily II helicase)